MHRNFNRISKQGSKTSSLITLPNYVRTSLGSDIINCIFANNIGSSTPTDLNEHAVLFADNNVNIFADNCLFFGNELDDGAGGFTPMPTGFGNDAGTVGTIPDNGNSLEGQDPLFVDGPGGDFHLQSASPAIDSGTTPTIVTVTDDIEGNPRPDGAAFDIGAYEGAAVPPATPLPASAVWHWSLYD